MDDASNRPERPSTQLPPGPAYPAALQTLFFMAMPERSIRYNSRRWGTLYTRRSVIWGNEVMVSDPELIKQVLTGDPAVFHAGEVNAPARFLLGNSSLFLLDGAPHLRERRRITPPFHGERMHAYASAMREATLQATSAWREGDAISLLPTMQRITMEIILRTVFGLADGPRRDELRDMLSAMLERLQSPLGIFLVTPALQRDLGRLTPWAAFVKARGQVNALIYAEIAERRAEIAAPDGERRPDVLSLMLEARDEEGQPMTDEELRDELMTLLVAGYETTAMALCWAFEKILSHPEVHARLLTEIDASPLTMEAQAAHDPAQGKPAAVAPARAAQSDKLEYLDATIKEALRLRPIVPMLGRKTKAPITLGGYAIPAETHIFPTVFITHHRPDIYPEPEAFRPERFLGKKPDPYAWFPFGGGVRRCLGMAFALYEMKIVLATVLARFQIRLAKPAPLRVVLRGFAFAPEGGTRVVIEGQRSPLKGQAPPTTSIAGA